MKTFPQTMIIILTSFYRQADGTAKWYKFDDGEVTECKMEDEEEMKTQCYGGDYMGEVSNFISIKLLIKGTLKHVL